VSCALNRRVASAAAFASAARSYWLDVFPVVRRELRRLRIEAGRIPDPTLRRLALATQEAKWANLEGAAVFAAFVPTAYRYGVARLLVGYQTAFDYADTLMEQPSDVPAANARQLHAALVAILEPGRPQPDYYRHHVCDHDGGYLTRLVDGCRAVVVKLPAYPLLAATVIESAQRGVEYQSRVSLSTEQDHPALSQWATQATPHRSLRWWEIWASCGSSLDTLALLAATADPRTNDRHAQAIDALYWPWAGALHGLLDCLVDHADDTAHRRPNLLDLYASSHEIAERMGFLATEAARLAPVVGIDHSLILAGMASQYIADPQAWVPAARPAAESILDGLGELGTPALLVLRARRVARSASA
jgi:tetraprenyl-beta-curcumene synthase